MYILDFIVYRFSYNINIFGVTLKIHLISSLGKHKSSEPDFIAL